MPTLEVPSLFASDNEFLEEALHFAFDDPGRALELRSEDDDEQFISLVPPKDLANRFRALPQSYLSEQRITERLRLTGTPHAAEAALAAARASTDSQWPSVGYMSPLHPMLDWLVDKVLANVGRNEAPVLVADVDRPTFAILGSYSNGRGQPQLVEWMAVSVGPDGCLVSDLFATLERAGVHQSMANTGGTLPVEEYRKMIPIAVDEARSELDRRKDEHAAGLDLILEEPRLRLERRREGSDQLALELEDQRRRSERDRYIESVVADTTALIDSMRTKGQPLVRVLALLAPRSAS